MMQLGTRWAAGSPVPRTVPEALHSAIVEAEEQTGTTGSWTLTFLEGRAVVELDAGVEVRQNADGSVTVDTF